MATKKKADPEQAVPMEIKLADLPKPTLVQPIRAVEVKSSLPWGEEVAIGIPEAMRKALVGWLSELESRSSTLRTDEVKERIRQILGR